VVIVGGAFEVDPSERDAFVAERAEVMRRSRAEQGCIEYVIAADPLEPGRAVLFERWASQADLDAHLAAMSSAPSSDAPSDAPSVAPTAVSIVVYDVSGEHTLA
jgi:quinol monooxygenase YgiN